jgi:hypothetical protein
VIPLVELARYSIERMAVVYRREGQMLSKGKEVYACVDRAYGLVEGKRS